MGCGCVFTKPNYADKFIQENKALSSFIKTKERLQNILKWLKDLVLYDQHHTIRITERYDDARRSTYSVWYNDTVGGWVYFVMNQDDFFNFFNDDRINVMITSETVEFNVHKVHIQIKHK
jgi:pyruvate carboxylase